MVDRFMQWYVDQVMAVSTCDPYARLALLRVFTMTHGPQILFHPRVLGAVIAWLGSGGKTVANGGLTAAEIRKRHSVSPL